ncbi:hypothetical protein PR048_014915 [Dryococelus australis]|uniref:Uncharacterized protein n=1 Tax=Dryococelus australis TaxID=614101 RepID=A0ABQ9HFI6_9NEOP|nr:hypothetical protein PR048_014915 [Dryococelus australis]
MERQGLTRVLRHFNHTLTHLLVRDSSPNNNTKRTSRWIFIWCAHPLFTAVARASPLHRRCGIWRLIIRKKSSVQSGEACDTPPCLMEFAGAVSCSPACGATSGVLDWMQCSTDMDCLIMIMCGTEGGRPLSRGRRRRRGRLPEQRMVRRRRKCSRAPRRPSETPWRARRRRRRGRPVARRGRTPAWRPPPSVSPATYPPYLLFDCVFLVVVTLPSLIQPTPEVCLPNLDTHHIYVIPTRASGGTLYPKGAMVAERLARSPPTKANRDQSPAG